jgi:hypothetical protein
MPSFTLHTICWMYYYRLQINWVFIKKKKVRPGVRHLSGTRDQFFFLFEIFFRRLRGLLFCSALSDERMGLNFTVANGPCQCSPARVCLLWREVRSVFCQYKVFTLSVFDGSWSSLYSLSTTCTENIASQQLFHCCELHSRYLANRSSGSTVLVLNKFVMICSCLITRMQVKIVNVKKKILWICDKAKIFGNNSNKSKRDLWGNYELNNPNNTCLLPFRSEPSAFSSTV